jgi:formylmethanofuran dehydrogenase subunit E
MKTNFEEEEMGECTRCGDMVYKETLVGNFDWQVCEICWDDL